MNESIKNYSFLGFTPYKHQLRNIEFILANKRCFILDDLGTGKTNSTLWALDILLENEKISKVLIIAPLSILWSVWAYEIKSQMPNRTYSIIHGTKTQRIAAMKKPAHFYLVNHDATRFYKDELLSMKCCVVVVDEVTAYANPSSGRSKGASIITSNAKGCIGISGNPTANGPMQAFGIAKCIKPSSLPTKYITKYRLMTMTQVSEWDWIPNNNWKAIVKDTLSPATRTTIDECVDLPNIIYEYREVAMSSQQKKLYKQMAKEQIIEFKNKQITALTAGVKFGKLLQIALGVVIDNQGTPYNIASKIKLNEVINILNESRSGKIVVFVQYISALKMLTSFLQSKNINAKSVYGDVSIKERVAIFDEMQTGSLEVLIAQPRTAAHGLTLISADTVVFYGPVLGCGLYNQAIGRIRRIGQNKRQVIVSLYSSPVEKRIFKKLQQGSFDASELLALYESNDILLTSKS